MENPSSTDYRRRGARRRFSAGGISDADFFPQSHRRAVCLGNFLQAAKMTVALTMIFLLKRGLESSSWVLILSAFAGSLITMFFVLMISGKVGTSSLLVVCGVMGGIYLFCDHRFYRDFR